MKCKSVSKIIAYPANLLVCREIFQSCLPIPHFLLGKFNVHVYTHVMCAVIAYAFACVHKGESKF